jgi:hypothetical protein
MGEELRSSEEQTMRNVISLGEKLKRKALFEIEVTTTQLATNLKLTWCEGE